MRGGGEWDWSVVRAESSMYSFIHCLPPLSRVCMYPPESFIHSFPAPSVWSLCVPA